MRAVWKRAFSADQQDFFLYCASFQPYPWSPLSQPQGTIAIDDVDATRRLCLCHKGYTSAAAAYLE
jgi:hypothetical protein